jgi:hypothetical protein
VLAAKILLAPTFVIAASLAARRYGARIGGLVGGLPVVAGPILLVFALDHGAAFAASSWSTPIWPVACAGPGVFFWDGVRSF